MTNLQFYYFCSFKIRLYDNWQSLVPVCVQLWKKPLSLYMSFFVCISKYHDIIHFLRNWMKKMLDKLIRQDNHFLADPANWIPDRWSISSCRYKKGIKICDCHKPALLVDLQHTDEARLNIELSQCAAKSLMIFHDQLFILCHNILQTVWPLMYLLYVFV